MTVSPIKTFCHKPAQKKDGYSNGDEGKCKEIVYQSRNLIGPYHFLVINLRNLTLFTRLLLTGKYVRSGHKTIHGSLAPKYCQDNVIFCTSGNGNNYELHTHFFPSFC